MAVESLSARMKYGLVGVAGKAFINTLAAFCDGELENRDIAHRVRAEGRQIIYAFWHGRLMVPLWTHRNSNVGILISRSRDGEYVARVAEKMGFHVIRGSSTRGAAESFSLLHEALCRRVRRGNHSRRADGPKVRGQEGHRVPCARVGRSDRAGGDGR